MAAAVIVAAGRGTRMGPGADKLFLEVAGRPVIVHTWTRFDRAACIDEIVLVVRAGLEDAFTAMAGEHGLRKPFRLAPGGPERQDSVWNGLAHVAPDTAVVVIHDGARPCASVALIERTIAAARSVGAAVAAQRVTDTLKESDDGRTVLRTVDRTRLWAVQTPQTFRAEVLRQALRHVRALGARVTDDTAACEAIGQPVALVESLEPNPKVTVPGDLAVVDALLRREVHG